MVEARLGVHTVERLLSARKIRSMPNKDGHEMLYFPKAECPIYHRPIAPIFFHVAHVPPHAVPWITHEEPIV